MQFLSSPVRLIVGFLLCVISYFQPLEATTTRDVFAKYPNKYFIETGSCMGDGIQKALDVGFKQVFSIELSPTLYKHCCDRFASHPNVMLLLGDSTDVLPQLLKKIDAPATFWLDGHYSWGNTAKGVTNTPLLSELEHIRKHHINTHTIMIDDVREFGTIRFDFIELNDVINKLLEINPNYQIFFVDGRVANDVLIAHIPGV